MHIRRFNYLRLIIAGISGIIFYLLWYYFMLSTDIRISFLYVPAAVRGFAYAVLSATFMVCLEEIMSFRHFFQALSVFNMLHMVVGGVVGAAIYSRGLSADVGQHLQIRLRSGYGGTVSGISRPWIHGGVHERDDGNQHKADLRMGGICGSAPFPSYPALRHAGKKTPQADAVVACRKE